jgi:hypothetical protein
LQSPGNYNTFRVYTIRGVLGRHCWVGWGAQTICFFDKQYRPNGCWKRQL